MPKNDNRPVKKVIIPNNDTDICLIFPFGDGDEYVRSPIIAWSIDNSLDDDLYYPEPITVESMCGEWFIELPERYGIRRFVFPEDAYFDTMKEALSYYRNKVERRRAIEEKTPLATAKPVKDRLSRGSVVQ